MRQLILALGLMAGAAHATDEYYALSSAMTNVTGGATVTGWIETDGFGNTGPARENSTDTLVVNYSINVTYDGVTEYVYPGPTTGNTLYAYWGIVAKPNGLFCNQCSIANAGGGIDGEVAFWITGFKNPSNAWYQYSINTQPGTVEFVGKNTFANGFMIGTAPTTTMPGARVPASHVAAPELDPGQAATSLLLLAGVGLALKGRCR
jgi:hypothetical protein